jgi:hypothetical protein
MLKVRAYDPAEFELATWTSNDAEEITFKLEQEDREYFQEIVEAASTPYTSIEDVLRHAVYRHVAFLVAFAPFVGKHNASSRDISVKNSIRENILEINFGVVLDFMEFVMETCLSERCFSAAHALEELLKCAIHRMRSHKLKELYMAEVRTRWAGRFNLVRHGSQLRGADLKQFASNGHRKVQSHER